MKTEYEKFLERFVQNYKGQRLYFIVAGGGVSLSKIALIPGASSILGGVHCVYDTKFTLDNMGINTDDDYKFVSKQCCKDLINFKNYHRYIANFKTVSITSAITSNYPRKGLNQAFFNVVDKTYHLMLDKLSDSIYQDSLKEWSDQIIQNKRIQEDESIAEVAIKLATGFEKETLKGMFENGNLRLL